MKKLLNKRGMTYVELLVAFTLLMLIVVSFTPMLLKSYEAVYSAGEKSANLYAARTKLEDGLATRRSADTENVTLNFTDYISETRIVGRRVPATTEAMLETLFYGAHSTIEIISPKHVPDDSSTYQVILQATNIPVTFDSVNGKTKADVQAAEASKTKDDNNVVALVAKAPVKTTNAGADTTTEDAAYDTNGFVLNMTVNSVDATNGKITITLKAPAGKSLDFTTSPIRIQAYYINERGIMKSVSDYLYIDPMTILIGGKTKSNTSAADYFTTAGVTKSLANTTASFSVEGRTMPLGNVENGKYVESPKGKTSFTTITWIDNDTENELAPYYVMTGTDGYIYRMYNFTHNGDLYKKTASQTNTGSLKTTKDGFMSLKSGAVAYPSFWSGDYTDWYSFQTAYKSNTYGVDQTDNNFDCSFLTRYNAIDGVPNNDAYSNRARYSMVFSGYKTGYNYLTARGRRLSYVLTEHGYQSFRLAGKLANDSDYKGFNARWESNAYQGKGTDCEYDEKNIIGQWKTDPGIIDTRPVYFTTQKWSITNWDWSTNDVYDKNYAPIYLKSYTSIPPDALESVRSEFAGAFWCPWDQDKKFNDDYGYNSDAGQGKSEATAATNVRSTGTIDASGNVHDEKYSMADWVSSKYATNVTLTSAAYIPVSTGEGKGDGQLVYFGTVPSYGLIMQHDAKNNTASKWRTPKTVWNCGHNGDLPATAYYVDGSAENGTNIYRFSGTAGKGAVSNTPIPARYARWIPERTATHKTEQYADPVPAQYATWVSKIWNPTTWKNGKPKTGQQDPAQNDLLLVKCEITGKKITFWWNYWLKFTNPSTGAEYDWDWLKDHGYLPNKKSFYYIDASTGKNPSNYSSTNCNTYRDCLDPENVGTYEPTGTNHDVPINMDSFSFKHKCDDVDDQDDFPSALTSGSKGDYVYLYMIKDGSDHVNPGSLSDGNYWGDENRNRVNVRSDIAGVENMIEKTGPGFWQDSNGNLVSVRSASDLSTYYKSSDTVAVGGKTIYTDSTTTSWGSPHTSGSVNARSVGNMIVGTGKGVWLDPAENIADTTTGRLKNTACWGDNGTPVTVRTDVAANDGGTDHMGGKPGEPDALNLIAETGDGYYKDSNGNVTTNAWTTTGSDDFNVYQDSKVVQNGIYNSLHSRAVPDTSHNDNDSFYNTFRDTKTYLYNDTNLEFTFGYCSNWLIGAGTVVIQSAAEMQSSATDSSAVAKSFEKFYTRSNPSATQGNGTATNNLFYDTWFPGEYYNLTQTATLDGVTVACGYAVAGAAFEAQPDPLKDGSGNYRYSTALGGIYNDGVLSIYETRSSTNPIQTGTGNKVFGGFRNILYYKSPTFDNAETHNRQSVRFTAVDLLSLPGAGNSLEYFAIYGDNHGNVYFSKVAWTSGSVTEDEEGNITPGTAQLNLATNITYGDMTPITVGGDTAFNGSKAMSTVFSEIEKITCGPNMVVITGKCEGNTAKAAVVYRERTGIDDNPESETYGKETYGDWKTKVVFLGNGHINDAIVLGDYYYAVGATSATGSVGKIWAVKISALVNNGSDSADTLPNLVTLTTSSNGSPLPELTCIGGRITGVNRADNDA